MSADFNATIGSRPDVRPEDNPHAIQTRGPFNAAVPDHPPKHDLATDRRFGHVPSARVSTPAASGAVTHPPFEARMASGTLSVQPGTLNGVAPTNNASTFSIPVTVTRYLVLNVTAADGVVSSSTLSVDSSPPAAIDTRLGFPPNTFSVLLYVIVDRRLFRVIGATSVQATSLEAFRVQKTITTPDMLPYDSYYSWQLTGI